MWNLFASGGQIMRAADCKNLSESPEGDFRQPEGGGLPPLYKDIGKADTERTWRYEPDHHTLCIVFVAVDNGADGGFL